MTGPTSRPEQDSDRIRQTIERLGAFGARPPAPAVTAELALTVEKLGYRAIWVGRSPAADLRAIEHLLEATSHLVVVTGVVNTSDSPAAVVAESYHRIIRRYPDRFVLGLGVGHPEVSASFRSHPRRAMEEYLDDLERRGVEWHHLLLAALGPQMLELAAARTLGAHPYLMSPEHTRRARHIMGAALLAPEQRVILEPDPQRARELARPGIVRPYFALSNYRRAWRGIGLTESDFEDDGTDRLVDTLAVYGDGADVRSGLEAHLHAGADHIAVQVLEEAGDVAEQYAALAEILPLTGRR